MLVNRISKLCALRARGRPDRGGVKKPLFLAAVCVAAALLAACGADYGKMPTAEVLAEYNSAQIKAKAKDKINNVLP
jgi:hypothetical protein